MSTISSSRTAFSSDYSEVKMWLDTEPFEYDPSPKTVDDYLRWIDRNLDFVSKRNARIEELVEAEQRKRI